MPPSRPTTCSGIMALFEPTLILSVTRGAENRPPEAASQIVTVTESPTPITGSADSLLSPK